MMEILRLSIVSFIVLSVVIQCHGDEKDDCKDKAKELKGHFNYAEWFKKCIADIYKFKADKNEKQWDEIPTFENIDIQKDEYFQTAAEVAEKFFKNDGKTHKWDEVKKLYDNGETCKNVLYVTAARYVYYTYRLAQLSKKEGWDFKLCKEEGNKYVLPESSCYPRNPGSKRCFSDADVGLVGPKSGLLVDKYNKFMKDKFGMTSEELFDNNVYAFSIELAMPELFVANKEDEDAYNKLKQTLNLMDNSKHYQMQDLVFAYHKVYMYQYLKNEEHILKRASDLLNDDYKKEFNLWYDYLEKAVKKTDPQLSGDERKEYDTNMYSWLVERIGKNRKDESDNAMAFLLLSHIYASEAYLSRGVLRVVVGAQQMKKEEVKERLTPLDHWTAMLENYGDTMKEYDRSCKERTVGVCLMKLVKYMWRMFNSAELLYKSLKENEIKKVEAEEEGRLEKAFNDESGILLTDILKHWIDDLKNKDITDIDEEYEPKEKYQSQSQKLKGKENWVKVLLDRIGCVYYKGLLVDTCIVRISELIRPLNKMLMYMTNDGKIANHECLMKKC